MLIALLTLEKRPNAFPGRTFWSFVTMYSVLRFGIEFFRGDDRGIVWNMISTSQLISIILLPLAIFMLWYLGRPAQPEAPHEAPRGPRKPRFA
jgi:phosphatidylglycerol:prolipoprotein diacylglycerol transferase